MRSISRLSRAAARNAPKVVTFSVCGMISTEKRSLVDLVHRERDAVERDRALGRDEPRQCGRRAQRQARHFGQIVARQKFGDAVDMTGHEVPAELVAEPQRALEIELRAAPPGAGRRDPQRFGSRVDGEGGSRPLRARGPRP